MQQHAKMNMLGTTNSLIMYLQYIWQHKFGKQKVLCKNICYGHILYFKNIAIFIKLFFLSLSNTKLIVYFSDFHG